MVPSVRPGAKIAASTLVSPRAVVVPSLREASYHSLASQGSEPPSALKCVSSLTVLSAAMVANLEGSALSVATAWSARALASVQAGSVVAMLGAPLKSWFGENTIIAILTSSPLPGVA